MTGYEALKIMHGADETSGGKSNVSFSFQGSQYNVCHGRLRQRPLKLVPSSAVNWWRLSKLEPLEFLESGWERMP